MTLRPVDWAEAVLSWTYTDAHGVNGAALLRRPRNQASASLRATPLPMSRRDSGSGVPPEGVSTTSMTSLVAS